MKVWNRATGWIAKQMAKVVGAFDSSIDVEEVSKNIDEETKRLNVEADLRSANVQESRGNHLLVAHFAELGGRPHQQRHHFRTLRRALGDAARH